MISQYILEIIGNLPLHNFDLLAVGITIAAIGILGFVIYINNKRSITNVSFLFFSVITILWSLINYLSYQITNPVYVLWLLRIVIFLGVWHSFSFFQFFYVFPEEKVAFPSWYKKILVPYVILLSLFTLTPYVFSGIAQVSPDGSVSKTVVQNGIVFFVLTVVGLLVASVIFFVKKMRHSEVSERGQYRFILIGTVISFTLLFIFNLILPGVFLDVTYIPYGAFYFFPFVAFTSYAIYKHKLFNIRAVAVIGLTFLLCVSSLLEIIFSTSLSQTILRGAVFLMVLAVSIMMNRFVETISEQREQLEKANVDLGKANEKLHELDQQKSEFISLASHQLRGPLGAIKGYASLILEGDFGPVSDKVKESVNIIFKSTEAMVVLVGDYLDISRIEQGRMNYDFTTFDFKELASAVVTEYQPTAEKAKIQLSFDCDNNDTFKVHADRGKIKQVIGNLIDNSIKYTPQGSVHVTLTKEKDKKILLAIKDTGVGILPEVLPHLFEKFTRAPDANKVNIMGTGLGLYVAKKMIEAHKGRVWAESEGKDHGSQFYIEMWSV